MVNDFQQGFQNHSMGKGQSFQKIVMANLNIHMQKNECGPYTIYSKITSKQI